MGALRWTVTMYLLNTTNTAGGMNTPRLKRIGKNYVLIHINLLQVPHLGKLCI